MNLTNDSTIVVLNFGAQYAQLIARRLRELGFYSVIERGDVSVSEIKKHKPCALVLSGGPKSVYENNAPSADREIFTLNIPILGICYGFQLIVKLLGGRVENSGTGEFGSVVTKNICDSVLLGPSEKSWETWMSHQDKVVCLPDGFKKTAVTNQGFLAAYENLELKIFGVQFHPEVSHTKNGLEIFSNFVKLVRPGKHEWVPENTIAQRIQMIKDEIGEEIALCALSGGVDSAVVAVLAHKALGPNLHCVIVDHGFMRLNEVETVIERLQEGLGLKIEVLDAKHDFLSALQGIKDPEKKRKIIGNLFIKQFEAHVKRLESILGKKPKYLIQGTLYPDIIESGAGEHASIIKTHHNVGGLPESMDLEVVEPLKDLFKDEVRKIGLGLGLGESIVYRHPFPGPGLAVRIVGEVTEERLEILKLADSIAMEEIRRSHLYDQIWQMPVILLADSLTVGVKGDARKYGYPIILRPVTSEDAMTAQPFILPENVLTLISSRVTNEIPEVIRVAIDVTTKPPGSIEWE